MTVYNPIYLYACKCPLLYRHTFLYRHTLLYKYAIYPYTIIPCYTCPISYPPIQARAEAAHQAQLKVEAERRAAERAAQARAEEEWKKKQTAADKQRRVSAVGPVEVMLLAHIW